jgi:hypothetical protein
MLIEATLLGLAVLTWKKLGRKEEWSDKREEMYQSALEHLKGPAGVAKLREIADSCEKNGFHAKAFALRERAKLRATDANVKKARHEAYLKGMRSQNVPGILALAASFEKISATGAAANLRKHAENVQNGVDDIVEPTITAANASSEGSAIPAPPPGKTPSAGAPSDREPIEAKAEMIPDEAPRAEPAVAEAQIPPPVVRRRGGQKPPEGFESRSDAFEAAKSATTNGAAHVEPTHEPEDQASAEGP